MNARNQTVFTLMLSLFVIALPVTHAQKLPTPNRMGKPPLPSGDTAQIIDLFGRVGKKTSGTGDFTTLSTGGTLAAKTTLRTGDESAILVLLSDGHFLRVGEKTVVVLNELGRSKGFSFKVLTGQVWVAMHDSRTACEVQTPSSKTRTPVRTPVSPAKGLHAPALFGIGYDLEVDQSMVSVAHGKVAVSVPGVGMKAAVRSGQYARYLRKPQPNIRLRTPEVLEQDAAQREMWNLLRAENWTKRDSTGNNVARLKRGHEKPLRQLTFSVSVDK